MSKKITIGIPVGMDFSALRLQRDPITLYLSFEWEPIEKLCVANNLDIAMFKNSPEENMAELIIAWYMEHRASGGAIDQAAEQIIAEVEAESVADISRIQSAPGKVQ